MRSDLHHLNLNNRVGLVILAAGASIRLGRPKQLLPFGDTTLLGHIATIAAKVNCASMVVVLGANADILQGELKDLPGKIVENREWEEGMASSLRAGITALEAEDVDAALVLLCDQPLITVELLDSLIQASSSGSLAVVCEYEPGGATGPPCLFTRSLFPDLLALKGTQGAKQLLARLPVNKITHVPFPKGRYDVDTNDDWRRLLEETSSSWQV